MDAIILAAGLGTRMEMATPKQFLTIKGKPILIYALEVLASNPKIDRIILSCHGSYLDEYKKVLSNFDLGDVIFVEGGSTRQQSVANALSKVMTDQVLIHEAARPLISSDFVDSVIDSLTEDVDGVVPVVPISFTVSIGNEYMEGILDRKTLRNIQLPQVFKLKALSDAHERAVGENYQATEDGTLVFYYGGKIKFVKGRESNIKVTTPFDIEIIDNLLRLGS